MGGLLSSCKNKNKNKNNNKKEKEKENQSIALPSDPAIDMVDLDGKTYLKYIMNYESIPYYIPQIRYAKVTDVRQNYTIVVAARFPNNESPVHRFPIKLKHVDKEDRYLFKTFGDFEEEVIIGSFNGHYMLLEETEKIVKLRCDRCGVNYKDIHN